MLESQQRALSQVSEPERFFSNEQIYKTKNEFQGPKNKKDWQSHASFEVEWVTTEWWG